MSLEAIIKPARWLDKKIQKQYTRIGKNIPDEHLYKVTSTLGFGVGIFGTAALPGSWPYICGGMLGWSDGFLNIEGLVGHRPISDSGDSKIYNPRLESAMNFTRGIRLPLFLLGAANIGKAAYDGINFVFNGTPLDNNTYLHFIGGFGILSACSSMYLKDQDPKLLQKQKSKVKEYLKSVYEMAKDLIPSPRPAPQPVSVRAYYAN